MNEAKSLNRSRTLDACSATIIFLAYLIAQAVVAGLLDGIGGDRLGPLPDFLSPIVGIVVMVSVARVIIPKDLVRTDPTGLAWVFGGWDGAMKGMVIGSLIGLGTILFGALSHPYPIHKHQAAEPIYETVTIPGIRQLIAFVVFIVLAPVSEEMMFRGVLYGGYRKSFGPFSSALVTTGIFVAMHFPNYIYAPVKVLPYVVVALALLWCRLHWNAIGPAIAAHGGYNLVVIVVPSVHWTLLHYHRL